MCINTLYVCILYTVYVVSPLSPRGLDMRSLDPTSS
jgi:hypothetical protein